MASSSGTRPDPDALLKQVQKEEAAAARGRLRIYFGSSAGVGKTFAMLSAARKAQQEGRVPVVGVVETHGRSETAALVGDLERLPMRRIDYRGRVLEEFDLDAALARRPELLLVDELAHSNVEGSRHPKRWQDVEELLAAGIDVWATLNVQHLESLNDVVGGITGIRVMETLPDRVFDAADEVVLVDLPADELLARLKAGKVYMAQHAERAAQHFFRKGNLVALREIALRRTADRVEDDVQRWRVEQSVSQVWKTEDAILACVGLDDGAEYVVRSAARLAGKTNASWHAVYVETPRLQRLTVAERERALGVLKLAEQLDAQTAVLSGEDAARVLVAYARTHNLSRLVIGRDEQSRRWPWQQRSADRVADMAPDLDVLRVGRPDPQTTRPLGGSTGAADEPAAMATPWVPGYAWAAAACVATTVLSTLLLPAFDLANIVMLFLLAVVLVAVRFGRGPAAFAAVLSVLSFDFFFVAPRFTFAVSDVQYLLTFAVMLAVGLITGQLTAGLRFQADIASRREERVRALFEFARDLSAALQMQQVVETSQAVLGRLFEGKVVLLLPDANERLQPPHDKVDGIDPDIAQWAFDKDEQAGYATNTLPSAAFRYIPLRAPVRTRGILALRPDNARMLLVPEQQWQLETFARLIAIALERIHFVEVAQEMLLRASSERLRNSLLTALSHDLRTPLSGLVGLADTLSLAQPPLPVAQQATAAAIRESAQRMNRLVNNLLDMARIQSGDIRLHREWHALEETVGSALRMLRAQLDARPVKVDIPAEFPLVEFDALLIERVIANLVENAVKYSPAGGPIGIAARLDGDCVAVSVADRGPGLPHAGIDLFGKFTRGDTESSTPGIGLGLAICRAFVEAHGGTIEAADRDGGGAVFTFRLPRGSPPDTMLEDNPAVDFKEG